MPVEATVRNSAATSGSLGIGVVFIWFWEAYCVKRWGQEPLSPDATLVLGIAITDLVRRLTDKIIPARPVLTEEQKDAIRKATDYLNTPVPPAASS